jgi:predicted DNA-binding transcriptional regulator AlpA
MDHIVGFYSLRDVMRITTLSRATIYRMVRAGTFPRPFRISVGRIAWLISDFDRWMADRLSIPKPLKSLDVGAFSSSMRRHSASR